MSTPNIETHQLTFPDGVTVTVRINCDLLATPGPTFKPFYEIQWEGECRWRHFHRFATWLKDILQEAADRHRKDIVVTAATPDGGILLSLFEPFKTPTAQLYPAT